LAQEYADERKKRFRVFTEGMKHKIEKESSGEEWSPEQIVDRAKSRGIAMVSHERIYQYIRENKAKGDVLYKNLRHRLKHQKRPVGGKKSKIIPNRYPLMKDRR
jgi:IS30 family transposase